MRSSTGSWGRTTGSASQSDSPCAELDPFNEGSPRSHVRADACSVRLRSRLLLAVLAASAFVAAAPAYASEPLSDSNVTLQSLAVNAKGEALVTYRRSDGKVRHVLVWGAVNSAISGDPAARQVRFQ